MTEKEKTEGKVERVVEPILPVEKKLVAGSIILAAILLGILYWVSWQLIA
ncbi:MAG: hypothetical protein ACK4SY_07720 [Pyrobaculum sp.]